MVSISNSEAVLYRMLSTSEAGRSIVRVRSTERDRWQGRG